ncbi:hypothetical protein M9978_06140 [Sphingomonas sp. MG17]|uniref:VOC domain-containing protein n=1 Tax=Sphingomonas tagetis TaxID=2949092 RepID=A0A9X2HQ93_9SPHN|nr:hypothetical protein [Sphingomonas tagetis]MCP3730005.1 hypothetical protein [Sphingomonas tagetis]
MTAGVPSPNIVQIVLGSDNLPLAKHLWSTVLGFAPAGDRITYTRHNGQVMGLGEWGGAAMLYMVGRQELLQLEFWTHSTPPQRALPVDWQPNDIGFCRLGISVPDFDDVLARLGELGVATITPPVEADGLRRVCFRDPTTGVPVEIMEEGAALPGERDRYHDAEPAVVYAAVSVADLDAALAFFGDVVGLERSDVTLHSADDEGLWGLPDAQRRVATLRGGTVFLEVVEYQSPAGGSPADDRLDRQGFKTIAVGHRDPALTGGVFERVRAAGFGWTVPEPASFIGGNHAIGVVTHRLKTLSVPHEVERQFGFSPEPQKWWRPPAHAAAEPHQIHRS